MFRCVMNFQPFCQPTSSSGWKGLVKGGEGVSIELFTHQKHLGAISIVFLEEVLYFVCPINGSAMLRHDGLAP